MLKLSYTFVLWVLRVSINFFFMNCGWIGWIAKKQNKWLKTQVNLYCVKGFIMNSIDGMFVIWN